MKELLLGNEAIARGAWEAGCRIVSSYPGTPSTEVTENCARYPEMYTEWATNEKVSAEVAVGASLGGARALCCMKHVGLNVAADPLYTAAYTGVNGGLVLNVADDPGMHSSQNEQDSRFHARAALVPMLEPSDSQECLDFTKAAFALSEQFDAPFLIRTTTRIAHARNLVEISEREDVPVREYKKDPMKNVMMPGMARLRHVVVEQRMKDIEEFANTSILNSVAFRDLSIGIITSGVAYQYVREAMPEASVLKLGIVNPIPKKLIQAFADKVERLVIIEELEPVIEEQVKAMGIRCEGKNLTGHQGELSVNKIRAMFNEAVPAHIESPMNAPQRPPIMCAGCPHRGPYSILKKLNMHVMGDIGCYTLGALAPLSALDSSLCMGASVGLAQGITHARGEEFGKKTVAVIGDSTFLHSGVTSLISAAYNKSPITLMILDNRITGMTGHQSNPASGTDIHGNEAKVLDLEALCRACGVERVTVVDAFDLEGLEKAIKEETKADEPSVIIARRACALLGKRRTHETYTILPAACKSCMACMKMGCPAIEKTEDGLRINPAQCVGCGLCAQTCKFNAIKKVGDRP